MDFYNRLNYSLGNEDWHVEEQALKVNSGDRIVCVTASGDRPLHLLMTNCSKILSVDANRIQNFLLDLKMIAISYLDYQKYIDFLGLSHCSHRYRIFTEIKSHLSKEAAVFWEKNKKMIENGVIYQGTTEKITRIGSQFIRIIRPKKIRTLFTFSDIESQREFLQNKWDSLLWRNTFKLFLNSNVLKILINDPGLNSYIDESIKPGEYIYQRILQYLNHHLASRSALLQLILLGRISPDAYLPYLTYEGYKKIRRGMDRLHYQTGNIIDFLNNCDPNHIDRFSLSDIASYMPQDIFVKLLEAIQYSAKPNARFCIREFMTRHSIPSHLNQHFQRDKILEANLEKNETNFVYKFFAGTISK